MSDTDQSDRVPTQDEMEELFVNNPYLEKIDAYLNRFNPIRIMRMERMEIRHSAILAWLLDPKETHGLDDRFLKAFLGEALRGQSGKGEPTALDVSQSDLRDAEIRREWRGVDILILCSINGKNCALVTENKFHSKQRRGQLEEYIKKVSSTFKEDDEKMITKGIFLTLWDEEPESDKYFKVNYDLIMGIISNILIDKSEFNSSEVYTFMKYYVDVLQEATGVSKDNDEMENIARKLYREHKKVLDFVIQHGERSEFSIAARELFGEDAKYLDEVSIDGRGFVFDGLGKRHVSFMPLSWYQALGGKRNKWAGCEKWWATYPLICWIEISTDGDGKKGKLRLYAEVGPISNHDFRKSLIESIKNKAEGDSKKISFRADATDKNRLYSRFFRENSTVIKDTQDPEEISGKIKKLLFDFRDEFGLVAEVLPAFEKFGDRVVNASQ